MFDLLPAINLCDLWIAKIAEESATFSCRHDVLLRELEEKLHERGELCLLKLLQGLFHLRHLGLLLKEGREALSFDDTFADFLEEGRDGLSLLGDWGRLRDERLSLRPNLPVQRLLFRV